MRRVTYSCYEAGPCGYWYHRELTKCGAVNYVVAPRPLQNQRSKHQKTDRLDARALLENLESHLRGNRDAMSIVAVPSPLQEQQRSVVRYREQLVRNRRRAEARGRALALTQGSLARFLLSGPFPCARTCDARHFSRANR